MTVGCAFTPMREMDLMFMTKAFKFIALIILTAYLLTGCGSAVAQNAGYVDYKKADIPDIHYDGSIGMDELNKQSLPKVLFDSAKAGETEAYLLGEYVRTDKSEDDEAIYSYYLKVAIEKDGGLVDCSVPAELEDVSQGGYVLKTSDIPGSLSVYEMSLPLVVLRYTSSSGAELSSFFAVKDGSLLPLIGDLTSTGGGMSMCVPKVSKDAVASGDTLKDSTSELTYDFDFDNLLPDDFIGAHFTAQLSK